MYELSGAHIYSMGGGGSRLGRALCGVQASPGGRGDVKGMLHWLMVVINTYSRGDSSLLVTAHGPSPTLHRVTLSGPGEVAVKP